jgi:hypothetical protein
MFKPRPQEPVMKYATTKFFKAKFRPHANKVTAKPRVNIKP